MKNAWTFALAIAASTAYAADSTTVTEKDYQLPKCDAPVASVVVGKISCKSAGCQAPDQGGNSQLALLARLASQQGQANFVGVGDGMAAMLTTALKETGCFDIQEREAMDDVAKELALVGKKVEVQQADFMISGAITSINMTSERKQLGGGFVPILGAFSRTKKTADIGLDMKIIDINRAKVIESKTFEANNQTSSTSFGGAAFAGLGVVGGSMSTIKGTPMEPIMRDILAQVASFSSTRLVAQRPAPGAQSAAQATPSVH